MGNNSKLDIEIFKSLIEKLIDEKVKRRKENRMFEDQKRKLREENKKLEEQAKISKETIDTLKYKLRLKESSRKLSDYEVNRNLQDTNKNR